MELFISITASENVILTLFTLTPVSEDQLRRKEQWPLDAEHPQCFGTSKLEGMTLQRAPLNSAMHAL